MPIYEFRCVQCGSRFEAIRRMGDSGADLPCPACGATKPEKLLSVFAATTSGAGGSRTSPGACGGGFT